MRRCVTAVSTKRKIVRTNRCQTHLNRLFLSTTSPQQLRQNRLLTRLRRRRPRLCPDEFRRPSVMTQCNSCEGVGVDQTLPSTISAKTLVPLPNRLRSFGVWRTLKTCLCGRLCCSRCLYHDDQHFSQRIKQDENVLERWHPIRANHDV